MITTVMRCVKVLQKWLKVSSEAVKEKPNYANNS